MSWKHGRPDDWFNPYPKADKPMKVNISKHQAGWERVIYECGASALLSALLKYLNEPCDKHLTIFVEGTEIDLDTYTPAHGGTLYYAFNHRKDCPQCMAELKENVK